MVYVIIPAAEVFNSGIDLEYERSPFAQRSWDDYLLKGEPVPKEDAPVLIKSKRAKPLPSAFEIAADVWCVAAKVKDLLQSLFSSQLGFHEIPVVVKATNEALPPTYFVSFANFQSLIDWARSKTKSSKLSHLGQTFEIISLVDFPERTVFKDLNDHEPIIWIEKRTRLENKLCSPGAFHAFTTDAAAQKIAEAFPKIFHLREFKKRPWAE